MIKRLDKKTLIITLLLLFLFMLPLFVLGGNSHVRIHDNLDSNVAWYKMLLNSGNYTAEVGTANIPQIMGGAPSRDIFDSEFVGIVWLYALFNTPTAFFISQLITRVFAFLGMYLLARDYLVKENKFLPLAAFASLTFALTPFWPSGMLSTLGMPLALWAFLNIRSGKKRVSHIFILTLLPFYSSFILGFCFFLCGIFILFLFDWIKKKQFNIRFLASALYMTLMYLVVNYRFIYTMFIGGPPDSRTEFEVPKQSFSHSVILSLKNFVFGHTHDQTISWWIILPTILITFILIIVRKEWKTQKLFIGLFLFNLALSFWYGFWWNEAWAPLKNNFVLLREFNFSRFHFLHPLIFYSLFVLALVYLAQINSLLKKAAYVLVALQIIVCFVYNPEIYYRYPTATPTINQFYAEKQMQEIKNYIGKPQDSYRVGSIGLHPAISQESGFYTVDGYVNAYPLKYKREFRKIIAPELEKSKSLKDYYDGWGNRCYLFSSELGKKYLYSKNSQKRIHHLSLNIAQFKKLGGKYILSSVPIENAPQTGLQFERSFSDSASYWKIYLYRAK
ncbi:hypothetical protein MFLO_10658 [Listeria floridensis FSL S10-1187]|uniref:YkoS n=1 Tax=Listeria floridensis FSL S10-1187 TaxID=1265817 RepID=A0ABN0RDZ1_9LIST|nr:DUF6044 family protein [Listeria floridensis]EUJ30277.1 hypothetical protein MFLO_10658 [Listeria floridensis FSL S10-1187]